MVSLLANLCSIVYCQMCGLLSHLWSIVFCHSYWLWSVVFVFWRMVSRKILICSFTSPMNIFFQVARNYCNIQATSKCQKFYLNGHTLFIIPSYHFEECFSGFSVQDFATHTTLFLTIFVVKLFFSLLLCLYIINTCTCLHKRYISIYQDFYVSISLSLWLFKSLVEIIETTWQYRNLPSQHKTKFIATFFFQSTFARSLNPWQKTCMSLCVIIFAESHSCCKIRHCACPTVGRKSSWRLHSMTAQHTWGISINTKVMDFCSNVEHIELSLPGKDSMRMRGEGLFLSHRLAEGGSCGWFAFQNSLVFLGRAWRKGAVCWLVGDQNNHGVVGNSPILIL